MEIGDLWNNRIYEIYIWIWRKLSMKNMEIWKKAKLVFGIQKFSFSLYIVGREQLCNYKSRWMIVGISNQRTIAMQNKQNMRSI